MWSKIFRMFVITILTTSIAHAQNRSEMFSQKKTQKKYLLQQIAALQAYTGYLNKGYALVHSGLGKIRGLTSEELSLHQTFIHSLASVSPVIRADPRTADVVLMQYEIVQSFSDLAKNTLLGVQDLEYINQVGEKLYEECSTDWFELLLVMTPGKVKMQDDERTKRLNQVHEHMQDKLIFTRHFSRQISEMVGQRQLEQNSMLQLEQIFNLTKQP